MTSQQDFNVNYLKFFFRNLLKSYSDKYDHIKTMDIDVVSEKFAKLFLSENPTTNSFLLMKQTTELQSWFASKIKSDDK